MFSDAKELAISLSRIYNSNASLKPNDWPGSSNELQNIVEVENFERKWIHLSDITRSSCAMVCAEQALDQLRAAVTRMGPEIDLSCKDRNTACKDYDSYRRRSKALEAKKESLDSQGKGNTPAYTDLLAEIDKFKNKLELSKENYNNLNDKSKEDIVAAKRAHDQLMDMLVVTTIVCQVNLFLILKLSY